MKHLQTIEIIMANMIEIDFVKIELQSINTPLVECAIKHLNIANKYLELEGISIKRVIEDSK